MEEKEPIKVKLSTVLLIIATLVIIAMGVIIGIMYKQSMTKENNVTNTENVALGENTININSNTEKTFSEAEIKDKFQSFLNLFGAYQGSPYNVLSEMKKITGKNVINDEYPEAIEYGESSILPTNLKYSEFKEFILSYMTEEFYNTDFARGYVNKDGDLYCKNIGATGVKYEVKSIEKENNSDTKYKSKVDMIYTDENKEEVNILFEIENNNGKCVISSITLPSENMQDAKEENNTESDSKNDNNIAENKTTESNNTESKNTNNTISDSKNNSNNKTDKYKEITRELDEDEIFYATNVEKNNGKYTIKGVIGTKYFSKSEYNDMIKIGKVNVDGKTFNIKKTKVEQPENDDYEVLPYAIKNNEMGYDYGFFRKNSKYFVWAREMQFGEVWKKTNLYKQITLNGNIPCEEDYGETQTSLDKEFKNFKDSSIESVGELIEHGSIYRFEFKNGKCVKLIHVVTGV